MALEVTTETVKAKCRITTANFDDEIDALIEEQLPAIEFAIAETHLNDVANDGLQATLNLGAAEIIAGEFLAQSFREPGACEEIVFGEVRFGVRPGAHFKSSIADPYGLKSQGWQRLSPFMKPHLASESQTRSDTIARAAVLSDEEFEKW